MVTEFGQLFFLFFYHVRTIEYILALLNSQLTLNKDHILEQLFNDVVVSITNACFKPIQFLMDIANWFEVLK